MCDFPATDLPRPPAFASIERTGHRSSSPPRASSGMIVRRPAVLGVALALGITCLDAAPKVEADPHELYERARDFLADGELRAAATSLARLKSLITERPDWDPEGVFARELLPPLSDRLNRLQGVARKL